MLDKLSQASKTKVKTTNNVLMAPTPAIEVMGNTTPGRILFLDELNERFISVFPALWKLGQAYFSKELFVKLDQTKQDEFKVDLKLNLWFCICCYYFNINIYPFVENGVGRCKHF